MAAHSLSCSANFVCQPMSVTVRFKGREKLSESLEHSTVSTGLFNRQSREFHPIWHIPQTPELEH